EEEPLEMLQTWVALPKNNEEDEPEFANYKTNELPTYTDTGIWMRLIAGEAYGEKSAVKTHSPLFYVHVKLDENAQINLPKNYSERAAYVVKGKIEIADEIYKRGQMIVFNAS